MNRPATVIAMSPGQRLWQALSGALRIGLHRFWRRALHDEPALTGLLLDEARALLQVEPLPEWNEVRAKLASTWPPRGDGPLIAIVREYRLDLAQTLRLTLLGEVERSHLIALVVKELQAPLAAPHPSVHLCASLVGALFDDAEFNPLDLAGDPLVKAGAVSIVGNGPLNLRTLSLESGLWSVLLERNEGWPGCAFIEDDAFEVLSESDVAELNGIATLIDGGKTRGIVLRGHPGSGRTVFAAALAKRLGRQALAVPIDVWQKSGSLAIACRFGGWLPVLSPVLGPGEVWRSTGSQHRVPMAVLLGSDGAVEGEQLLEKQMMLPSVTQRQKLWSAHLGSDALAEACARIALISGRSIETLASSAVLMAAQAEEPLEKRHVVRARRRLGGERLRLLAEPVEREVTADAIVLNPVVSEELDRFVMRARQRETLWDGLGTTLKQTKNPGVRALFVGDSGTGKTLAASYVATLLGAPLYRVDLAAVMNKYVGESEKNLSLLLDQAAASDVVLLFDEADSLFGRRTEGKETGERFANMLTHFLLTRIENHPGIVILTSNNRERIDEAFNRRLDLIIEFPPPGFDERRRLWESHLGNRGPGDAVYRFLAGGCDFSGGQLRNVVLAAASIAGSGAITSAHLLVGLEAEYRKIGRDLPAKLAQLRRL